MAAASAVKGGEPSESGPPGQTNVPLKVEENQDSGNSSLSEKQGSLGESSLSNKEKNEQAAKKFVDAPLPVTNAWTRRSTSLTSAAETSQVLSNSETKKEIVNDKHPAQVNATSHKTSRIGKGSVSDPEGTKTEKQTKIEKPKADQNGSKQADSILKPKMKTFGEDYVEAPLPVVNPWKKPSFTAIAGVSPGPFRVELDPTPAAAALSSPFITDVHPISPAITSEPKKETKHQDTAPEETAPKKGASPALADDNWPTLHEVKVTEPNQVMPLKPAKSPKVKVISTTMTTTDVSPVADPTPEVSNVIVQQATETNDVSQSTEIAQAVVQNDLGGDDSSKENKDGVLNGDDTNNAVKNKKGTKPKWQRMEIEHPKPDRRNRRSRSQGRGTSPNRRDGRPAGDRFHRPNSRKSDGPDSQDWRANMISQTVTATSPTAESARNGTGGSFVSTRGFRGRGATRGTALRRGGGRGRGGSRDTKSPPFQSNHNSWNNEHPFPIIPAESDTVPVPWSQGFNRVAAIPRVPPINPGMLGLDTNIFLQEQLINILGQSSVFYESTPPAYAPETLKHQVEYYFSEDNLVKDLFLRKKMDKQGWVKLELVLSFNKVKELKADYGSLIQAIRCSDKLELSEREDFVRTLNTPDVWPIEEDLKGMPPPPAVQRVAAMSTLHSDAPEFVPGKPFVLRSLTSDAPEFVPASQKDGATRSGSQRTHTDEDEDSLLCHATSNLTTIPPMLSSR